MSRFSSSGSSGGWRCGSWLGATTLIAALGFWELNDGDLVPSDRGFAGHRFGEIEAARACGAVRHGRGGLRDCSGPDLAWAGAARRFELSQINRQGAARPSTRCFLPIPDHAGCGRPSPSPGAVPFHFWLPDNAMAAPTPVRLLHSATHGQRVGVLPDGNAITAPSAGATTCGSGTLTIAGRLHASSHRSWHCGRRPEAGAWRTRLDGAGHAERAAAPRRATW